MESLKVLNTQVQWANSKRSFVLALVVETTGSAPRKAGSRMLIGEGTDLFGTVGGGQPESQVIEEARVMLAERTGPRILNYDLSGKEDSASICGGSMRIYLEPWYAPEEVIIFGAGHVAAALCPVLVNIGFSVTVYDERTDCLARSAFNHARRVAGPFTQIAEKICFTLNTYAVVMTPNHSYDYEVIKSCIIKPWYYFGVMASRGKKNRILEMLQGDGIERSLIERLTMPIGIDIPSETPAEIAIAIGAQLIKVRRSRYERPGQRSSETSTPR